MYNRPIIQILTITFITLIIALVGMLLLIGEVRQEILCIVAASLTLPSAQAMPPGGPAILALTVLVVVVYLLVRTSILIAVPRLRDAHNCPRCADRLQRTHRQKSERLLATIFLLRIVRYGCVTCEWSGLRRHLHRHRED